VRKVPLITGFLFFVGLFTLIFFIASQHNIDVLNPQGIIAAKQRDLLFIATLLMLIVVIPVFLLTFFIVWRYREDNKKAKYSPNWSNSNVLETIWWMIPFVIIVILAVITWKSSHELDPYRALNSEKKAINIQVISLQWKWLFIYPDQKIAAVNYIRIPEKTPINFKVTSDAPMNSFWIPSLGGQVYAMAGMSTKLHLEADHKGTYRGVSANISGKGFAGMKFKVESTSDADFRQWSNETRRLSKSLDMPAYDELAKPSENQTMQLFSLKQANLYDKVVMKYMARDSSSSGEENHNIHSGE